MLTNHSSEAKKYAPRPLLLENAGTSGTLEHYYKNLDILRIMKVSEKLIEKKLREQIKGMGGLALKLESTFFTGLPDRMVLLPQGRIFFVETKSTGDNPSRRQRVVHKLLRGLGFSVDVIDSIEGLNEFIRRVSC